MRCNGTLRYEIRSQSTLNEYGEPIAAPSYWSDPIRCAITANSDTRLGKYEDGEFRQASYVVLLEYQDIDFDRIQIERGNEILGDFRVQCIEPLPTVGRLKVTV